MTPDSPLPQNPFAELLTDLYYPSESDEPVAYVDYPITFDPPLSVSQLKNFLLITPEVFTEEIPESQFWEPVVTEQDWYGEEEKTRTNRFRELQQRVTQFLTDRQAFRVGQTEVDLYLLGRKADGHWAGLKTKVVET